MEYCTDTEGSFTVMYRYKVQLYSTVQIQGPVVQYCTDTRPSCTNCTDTRGSCTVVYRYKGKLYRAVQIQGLVLQYSRGFDECLI